MEREMEARMLRNMFWLCITYMASGAYMCFYFIYPSTDELPWHFYAIGSCVFILNMVWTSHWMDFPNRVFYKDEQPHLFEEYQKGKNHE